MEKNFLTRDKIVGKQVVGSDGVAIGTIKEIAFDLAGGKMTVTVADDKGKETEIPSDNVAAVGDIVLLGKQRTAAVVEAPAQVVASKPTLAPPPAAKTPAVAGLCPNCAYQNEADSRFCIKCGTRLK